MSSPTAKHRRWRSTLRLVAIGLVLGLATTLAVAWTLAFCSHPDPAAAVFHEDPGRWWFLRTTSAHGGAVRFIWVHPVAAGAQLRNALDQLPEPRILASWQRLMDAHQAFWFYSAARTTTSRQNPTHSPMPAPIDAITSSAWAAVLDERGWPLPALCARISLTTDLSAGPRYVHSWGMTLPPVTTTASRGASGTIADQRTLPLRPVWRGMAVDLALYTLTWLALIKATRAISARLRRKPGTCPRCGYELTGLAPGSVCPECGAAGG